MSVKLEMSFEKIGKKQLSTFGIPLLKKREKEILHSKTTKKSPRQFLDS